MQRRFKSCLWDLGLVMLSSLSYMDLLQSLGSRGNKLEMVGAKALVLGCSRTPALPGPTALLPECSLAHRDSELHPPLPFLLTTITFQFGTIGQFPTSQPKMGPWQWNHRMAVETTETRN